jgi:uncharacterized protein (DUF169 family)
MDKVESLNELLGLRIPAVAVAFLDEPPAGLQAWEGPSQPAGCAFWRWAGEGRAFYTKPSDHYNCAVGSYTHAIELPAERSSELDDTIKLMAENSYLRVSEVPGIPRLAQTPSFIAYGPADAPGFQPDVVLITATPYQAMLIYEAAIRAGLTAPLSNIMGRPTCAVLPLTLSSKSPGMSLGCAGNRVHTGLGNHELYVSIPGANWSVFKAHLVEILEANRTMVEVYEEKEKTSGAS